MRKKLLGYYDYTVVLTYCGTLFAICGIFCAVRSAFVWSILLLMLSGTCDMFDGTVARTKQRTTSEKRFGIQIDSMSDLISFGVLPGVFSYIYLGQTVGGELLAAAFILCALIRLSYFNVMEEERQQQTTEQRETFFGLPVTSVALILPMVYILCELVFPGMPLLFSAVMLLTALCFLLRVEIKKPKMVGKIILLCLGMAEMAVVLLMRGGHLF